MNSLLVMSIIAISLWTIFVVYCLFNGQKIEVQTKNIRSLYWVITAFSVIFVLYSLNGLSTINIILMVVMLLSTSLYISVPSGYNKKGIFIRGLCCPYSKIENMNIESILRTNRLNFKCYHRILYIDSDDYKVLKQCEMLYKKERYHD